MVPQCWDPGATPGLPREAVGCSWVHRTMRCLRAPSLQGWGCYRAKQRWRSAGHDAVSPLCLVVSFHAPTAGSKTGGTEESEGNGFLSIVDGEWQPQQPGEGGEGTRPCPSNLPATQPEYVTQTLREKPQRPLLRNYPRALSNAHVMKMDWNWMKQGHFTTGGVAQQGGQAIRGVTLRTRPAPARVDLVTSSR